jgi:hypothetical protein
MGDLGEEIDTTTIPEPDWTPERPERPAPDPIPEPAPAPAPERKPEEEPVPA